jgi:hypothetical protein
VARALVTRGWGCGRGKPRDHSMPKMGAKPAALMWISVARPNALEPCAKAPACTCRALERKDVQHTCAIPSWHPTGSRTAPSSRGLRLAAAARTFSTLTVPKTVSAAPKGAGSFLMR